MNRSFPLLLGLLACCCASVSAQYFSALEKLSTAINTQRYDEIRPIVGPDGQELFFTREAYPLFNHTLIENGVDRATQLSDHAYKSHLAHIYSSLSGQRITDPVNSSYNQDIWIAQDHKGIFDQVNHPEAPINNAFPNSICAFNAKENTAIVLNQFPEQGGILPGFSIVKRHSNARWGKAEPMQIEGFVSQHPDVNLSLSEDGEVLILSMQGERAYGNSNDLYVSFRLSDKRWSKPRHLGPAINSVYHEKAPFLSKDTQTLFFASNRRGGAGGSDIYFIQRLDDTWTRWTAPRRFLSPVNSASDDSHPFFHKASGYLYFTSKREGSSDIFRVKISTPAMDEVAISGKVLASDNGEKVKAVIFAGPSKNSFFRHVYESTDGHYSIRIPKGEAYEITAQKPGYIGRSEHLHFPSSHVYFKDYQLDLTMDPMESGKRIPLRNIYFEQSTAQFVESSWQSLDLLAQILQQNPGLYISIEGHTDNVGEREILQKLSEERSRAIGDYLVGQKGIAPQRLHMVGYGASFPLNDNSTEGLRRRNRRVEIRINYLKDTATVGK